VRITDVRTVLDEFPWRRPMGDVQLPTGARTMAEVAVFLATDEEAVGVAVASAGARPFVGFSASPGPNGDATESMTSHTTGRAARPRPGRQRAALRAHQGSCGRRT
jgi:hypothetical protein